MFDEPWPGRFPRAHLDPIDSAEVAYALIAQLSNSIDRDRTLAILLDHEHRGISIVDVDGTIDPDAVLVVADVITEFAASRPEIGAAIIATVRPGGSMNRHDPVRWVEASEVCELGGVELLDWVIVGRQVVSPRAVSGAADRWIA